MVTSVSTTTSIGRNIASSLPPVRKEGNLNSNKVRTATSSLVERAKPRALERQAEGRHTAEGLRRPAAASSANGFEKALAEYKRYEYSTFS